jgi:hypothetical protein
MSVIVTVVTDGGSGGTFLTWSLHFLSGATEYFSTETKSWTKIVDNPLTSKNSHGFIPNQLNRIKNHSIETLNNQIKLLQNEQTNTFHTLYFHETDDPNLDNNVIDLTNKLNNKTILLRSYHYPLYHDKYASRGYTALSPDDAFDEFCNKYFKDSAETFQNLNLTNIWDKREFIALNFDAFRQRNTIKDPDNYYYLDALELWTNFDISVKTLFDYLNLGLDTERFEHWKNIYNNWKKLQFDRLQFQTYFDKIINSIINNTDLDLERFNLDIQQEATIQRTLLYKHNLALKTWQLEKFINTQQLHSLLEPNTYHNL